MYKKIFLVIVSLLFFLIVTEVGLGYLYFQKENNISSGWIKLLRKVEGKFNLSLLSFAHQDNEEFFPAKKKI
tara:strand:+ start:381 stop:596 length:216 start_codon:yes stop_codon:yes gene_type:complete